MRNASGNGNRIECAKSRTTNRAHLLVAAKALALLMAILAPCSANAQEMWKAKAPASGFVPDWSKADATDAEATGFFLTNVWPELKKASDSLQAKLKAPAAYAGEMSDAEKAAGVVCFPLRVEQILPANAVPTAKQVAERKFSIFAARATSEAVCVGVHALADARQVSVACSELQGAGVIPASAVTTRLSLAWNVNPRGRGAIDSRQMILLKADNWDLAKGDTREWVVDVHVPSDAAGGKYSGKITVAVAGKTAAEFALELEVLPAALTDNGCRWGMFMTPNPVAASEAWCDLNARYGMNTLAWWCLDTPPLTWTWDGCKREESVLAKLRDEKGEILPAAQVAKLPDWVKARWDGTFLTFKLEEVVDLPRDAAGRAPFYKKPLKLKPELGALSPEQAQCICYDRPGVISNFTEDSIKTVQFARDDAFAAYDAGMKRLAKHGFAGPITYFGSAADTVPWEVRVVAQRFGPKYTLAKWKWRREVAPENANHLWYLANAAIAKSFQDATKGLGWPEVTWCPNDESLQHRGVTGRTATNMIGEMMPYVRQFAPDFRVYMVCWHTKEHNWNGMWQCAVMQRDLKDDKGVDAPQAGPYQVICTNCPNDQDRQLTWDAGGEYWTYTGVSSAYGPFSADRFAFGFNGARHYSAVVYSFADAAGPFNPAAGEDLNKSLWITGEFTTNYYLSKARNGNSIDYALASHAALACRGGVTDRKYLETLRKLAHEKNSADDIAFVTDIGKQIDKLGGAGKGGQDNFQAEIKDEGGAQQLRRQIAERIKALIERK